MAYPEIHHHGAVTGVTGSCHELRLAEDAGILIDCGLFQGAETSGKGAGSKRLEIEFPIDHIKALLLTHVHIDHCGRLPYLLAAGFNGPIYCSKPSAILLPLVIEDAVKVGVTRNRQMIKKVIDRLKRQLRPIDYNTWTPIDTGEVSRLAIRLQRAGHILGSAYAECKVTLAKPLVNDREHQTKQVLVFSGDLGAPHTPLLPTPKSPYRADTLIIESTYGDRLHEDRKTRLHRLQTLIEKALRDRGTVLIPAFSIGRTQELLYELEDIIHRCRNKPAAPNLPWKGLEIVIDSPLAAKFTGVYRKLKPYWDAEAKGRVRAGRHPLTFKQLRTVDSHPDHLKIVSHLARGDYPCIVLAASGMCAGGRIVNYLKALIGRPSTDVLFVGYQAQGTPGRAIQRYGPKGGWVELDRQRYDIRAGIHTVSGYSAHADQADLLRFAAGMQKGPRAIRIVHGDPDAKRSLKDLLISKLPDCRVSIP